MRITTLCTLIASLSPSIALAGTTYSDVATWSGLTTTVSTEDFEAYSASDTPSGSYTGFTATALTGVGFEYIDFAGDMSLCDGDGGVAPEIEFVLDTSSTLFALVPQSLDFAHEVCGYYGGSLVECIAITSNATFTGYEFVSLVDTVVFDATVIDSICVGSVYTEADNDGDGYTTTAGDCDDLDSSASPAATEATCDRTDNDCDGSVDEDDAGSSCYDDDGDGYSEEDGDCDDTQASINPDAAEVEDSLDNDCDGITDEGTDVYDDDGDGWTEDDGDCDDEDPDTSPDGVESCNDTDDDCDGTVDDGTLCYDDDGDGYTDFEDDCNDEDPNVHPGATEVCNTVDDDCDDLADVDDGFDTNGDGTADCLESDLDGDGSIVDDCAPTNPAIYPGAEEICDGLDNNCDDEVDNTPLTGCYDDDDDGWTDDEGDCDDYDPLVNPSVTEVVYNGVDDDCNEETLDDDLDQDGYGLAEDCDDADAAVNPGVEEIANDGIDQDCDGSDRADTGDDDSGDDDSGDDDSGDDDSSEPPAILAEEEIRLSGAGCIHCQTSLAPTWDRGIAWLALLTILGLAVRRRP